MAKRKNAKQGQAKLPAGFTPIAVGGGFGAWWDHNAQRKLTGKVVGFDSIKTENGKRGVLKVETSKGVTVNVGESHALKELFTKENQKLLRGKQIYIEFQGQDTFKKGRETRKVNKFAVAIK